MATRIAQSHLCPNSLHPRLSAGDSVMAERINHLDRIGVPRLSEPPPTRHRGNPPRDRAMTAPPFPSPAAHHAVSHMRDRCMSCQDTPRATSRQRVPDKPAVRTSRTSEKPNTGRCSGWRTPTPSPPARLQRGWEGRYHPGSGNPRSQTNSMRQALSRSLCPDLSAQSILVKQSYDTTCRASTQATQLAEVRSDSKAVR